MIRGELPPGTACLEESVGLDPSNPSALLNLAAARRRSGDLTAAITLLQRALVVAPSYRKAQENLEAYGVEARALPEAPSSM